jgi:hypothetical protein
MTFQPAHKDTKNPPAQLRQQVGQELHEMKRTGQIKNEVTLQDYMERKKYIPTEKGRNTHGVRTFKITQEIDKEQPKKLTFDEWYNQMYKDSIWEKFGQISRRQAENVWFHAQENK